MKLECFLYDVNKEHAIRKTREMLYRHLDTDFAETVRRYSIAVRATYDKS